MEWTTGTPEIYFSGVCFIFTLFFTVNFRVYPQTGKSYPLAISIVK
jgi:hypothetical protein